MTPGQKNWEELELAITGCRRCPRLVEWREQVAREKKKAYRDWVYWGKGVPGFGDRNARVLVVGLAPGAHGSNRTGRMFTGDSSGNFLYPALFRAGFSNREFSVSRDDPLELTDLYITAVCRCAPPGNKPTPDEIRTCQPYLQCEVGLLQGLEGIVALGGIAFTEAGRMLASAGAGTAGYTFGHGRFYQDDPALPWLLGSYHPSRQNTQTGRLTPAMFDEIWIKVRGLISRQNPGEPSA